MGTWSNSNHSWNDDDMDSSDGTHERKLVVRNHEATASGQYRAEILETGDDYKALRVQGKTVLEHPVQGENERALKVTGKAEFRRMYANEPDEMIVDGNLVLERVTNGDEIRCGAISPNTTTPAEPYLGINYLPALDPDVKIGWTHPQAGGNRVYVKGRHISLGATEAAESYRVGIAGPALLEGTARITDVLQADSGVMTNDLEVIEPGAQLSIGTDQAGQVLISQAGHITSVQGTLNVHGTLNAMGSAIVTGHISATEDINATGPVNAGTNVTAGGSVQAAADVTAGGSISGFSISAVLANVSTDVTAGRDMSAVGKITAGGDLTVNGNGNVTGSLTVATGDLVRTGTFKAKESEITHTVRTTMNQSVVNQRTLLVEHGAASGVTTAAEINNASSTSGATGLRVTGQNAIVANGNCELSGTVKLNGVLNLTGHDLILGGTGANEARMHFEPGRFEFMIGGTRRFYIDQTGGHNG